MSSKIIYGKYVVADSDTVIPSGALYIEKDKIADMGSYSEIREMYSADEIIGSTNYIVIPGFVNAHSHGKGVTDFQRGQIDDTLETWKWRKYPAIDPYYDTLWSTIRLIESGVTTTMHNHGLVHPEAYYEEFTDILKAYKQSGLRVAFAPTLNTENVFIYGDNEAFIRSLSPKLQELCRNILGGMKLFSEKEYFQSVRDLNQEFSSSHVRIMHGPMSPQWVTDEALQEIKRQADELGLRIHIHTQQTQLQNLYGYKKYGKSLLGHLEDLNFLDKNVTCGHCVWLSEQDIQRLADKGTSVTHHAGCNLRVRNGIAPVFEMLQRGVVVAIGMDEKEVGDNKDFLEEMRMVSKLHRLSSHRLDSRHLLPEDVFRMGTACGAEVLGYSDLIGSLKKGKQADIVLLDLKRMTEPFVYPEHNIIDLLIYRGSGLDVDTVLVDGEVLLKNRKLTRMNRGEVISRLQESISERYEKEFREANMLFPALREEIAKFFKPWYDELESMKKEPYYL